MLSFLEKLLEKKEVLVVGYLRGISKAGKPFTMLHIVVPYFDDDSSFTKVGFCCKDMFIPENLAAQLQKSVVGTYLEADYLPSVPPVLKSLRFFDAESNELVASAGVN